MGFKEYLQEGKRTKGIADRLDVSESELVKLIKKLANSWEDATTALIAEWLDGFIVDNGHTEFDEIKDLKDNFYDWLDN